MSEQSKNVAVVVLTIVGGVLLGLTFVLGGIAVWCAMSENPLVLSVCSDGNLTTVAIALIGAASAMWAAHKLRETLP